MCLDKEILSTYLDGEVPEPWGGEIARHIAECPRCAQAFGTLQSLSSRIREAGQGREMAELLAGQEKCYLRLMARRDGLPRGLLLGRRISLPLPALAAAALICLFIGAVFRFPRPGGADLAVETREGAPGFLPSAEIPLARPAGLLPEGTRSYRLRGRNLEDLADIIKQRDEGMQVFIELPPASTFSRPREPQFIRGEDFKMGSLPGSPSDSGAPPGENSGAGGNP
ncbi:MAG: zf-HC2 domain-containing protein [Spirochaetales bacterium]|jgi:hypothetical protein|nr:zf-HC2 domain-containing protein [Spirochaetales bacterium]